MGKIINKADEAEAAAEGLELIEMYAGAFPWSKLSGSPMDNADLVSILESFGVTPDMIKVMVEEIFDALMVTSAGALKSMQKIALMMEENELWDFTEFMQILDGKTERYDFEEHAQNHSLHLSDSDIEALSAFWDLVGDVEEITGQVLNEIQFLEALVTRLQESQFTQASDLNQHIASGLHLHEGEREEILDHINNEGEYRHFTEAEYASFFDGEGTFTGGGGGSVGDYFLKVKDVADYGRHGIISDADELIEMSKNRYLRSHHKAWRVYWAYILDNNKHLAIIFNNLYGLRLDETGGTLQETTSLLSNKLEIMKTPELLELIREKEFLTLIHGASFAVSHAASLTYRDYTSAKILFKKNRMPIGYPAWLHGSKFAKTKRYSLSYWAFQVNAVTFGEMRD